MVAVITPAITVISCNDRVITPAVTATSCNGSCHNTGSDCYKLYCYHDNTCSDCF